MSASQPQRHRLLSFVRKRAPLAIAFVAVVLCGYAIPRHFSVTLSPSLNYRVFFLERANADKIKPGAYVLFSLPAGVVAPPGGPSVAIKRVSCAPGDVLVGENRRYYCNGTYLGEGKDLSSHGKPLAEFKWSGVVPPGRLFLMGDHERSYDSRYWGFLDWRDVEAVARPIF